MLVLVTSTGLIVVRACQRSPIQRYITPYLATIRHQKAKQSLRQSLLFDTECCSKVGTAYSVIRMRRVGLLIRYVESEQAEGERGGKVRCIEVRRGEF